MPIGHQLRLQVKLVPASQYGMTNSFEEGLKPHLMIQSASGLSLEPDLHCAVQLNISKLEKRSTFRTRPVSNVA